jgi:hypothetical protein
MKKQSQNLDGQECLSNTSPSRTSLLSHEFLPTLGSFTGLAFHEFAKHLFRVDGDEDSLAPGQDFSFFVEDFGFVDVLAAVDADFPALDVQRFVERDGLEVLDGHFFRQGDHLVELVYFAHRVVKDGRDDAAVAVAGRASVALAEAEFADEGLAFFVEGEPEAHAFGIVLAAGEAVVLLELVIGGFVSVDLAGHGGILS